MSLLSTLGTLGLSLDSFSTTALPVQDSFPLLLFMISPAQLAKTGFGDCLGEYAPTSLFRFMPAGVLVKNL